MRLTSAFWVSAYLRRCDGHGVPGVVVRRGNAEAGAIFIRVDRLDGTVDLYGPAPQTVFSEETSGDRLFVPLGPGEPEAVADADNRLAREVSFDSDLWIVEIESRDGTSYLDLVPADRL
ncbi:MAG: DUF1491 family protein [Hyphomicrobiales bacterium]|nr:DUF1491 family protein [Hyphomicrobiales bacterium]